MNILVFDDFITDNTFCSGYNTLTTSTWLATIVLTFFVHLQMYILEATQLINKVEILYENR